MRDILGELQKELADLKIRVSELADENTALQSTLQETEQEHFRFVNLYVACQRLSIASQVSEVVEIVQEIVVNLVGSEQFGLYLMDPAGGPDMALAVEVRHGDWPRPLVSHATVQEAIGDGKIYLAGDVRSVPAGVVPIRWSGTMLGAIVFYGVLPQKSSFSETDRELLDLVSELAGKALATAVTCSPDASVPEVVRRILSQTTSDTHTH